MYLGYNTNGLAHHRSADAAQLLAEVGYRGVAITLEHFCLAPDSPNLRAELQEWKSLLSRYDLRCVVETGARFLLDARRKHQPTLLSSTDSERERRLQFLRHSIDIAAELQADAVSFWSGTPSDDAPAEELRSRLVAGCRQLCDYAVDRNVRLAFEPEPGMLLETMDQFRQLREAVNHPHFGLTLDIGHVHCLQDGDIPSRIREFADCLWNLHLEDMRPGVHDHLRFGEGTIPFPPIFSALAEVGYSGGLFVELSRHSHMAPAVVQESMDFLRPLLAGASAL